MIRRLIIFVYATWVSAAFAATTPEFIVYPNQGQTAEQQSKDEFECYQWSKNQSGFDPMVSPTTTTVPPPTEQPRGGILRGALRGAAVGEILDDDASSGAKAGALIGGTRRRTQVRRESARYNQWAQQEAAAYSQSRDLYNRHYAACLEGRGYTVK